jgi:signal transduction histidine kinase/HAMP domain-containing protein
VRNRWFLVILAIVVIPVTMTCIKIIQYTQESKGQVYELHHHIVSALNQNTSTYFQQLNMRLAFAPLLARTREWGEQISILNNALLSNSDFACVALLNSQGKELAKAYDSKIAEFRSPLNLAGNKLFLEVKQHRQADTGSVYEREGKSYFDILYPLENQTWMYVSIRWEALKKMFFDQQVGKAGYIWILDTQGVIVGDSQNKSVGKSYLTSWRFFEKRLEEKEPWNGEFTDPEGIPSVGAAHWNESAGWFVLSAQPQSEAYAKIATLKRQGFFWVAISFLGIGLFGYFWLHHISSPITKLAAGVVNVAKREFNVKVPENFGLEEFRALGKAFNQMTQELQVYNAMQVEKIVDEKTKVEALLFSIQDGIFMISEQGELLFANNPAKQWTVDVAGHGKAAFEKAWVSLQEYPPWLELLQPVIARQKLGDSAEFEFPVKGRSRWAKILAQQVLTEDRREIGIMVIIHDVTQDKELDKMKEDFFNGITHDLRTPLAATIGYLGLGEIQVPEDNAELGTLVGSAKQSAKRALSLVETILSLARLQAGKLAINPVPVQAKALIGKIANDLSFQAAAKKITLTAECEDPTLWVQADQSLMERVVENLTGNAIKYTMEKGWVKITARLAAEGVEIAIQDNGRGIPPEALQKLFGKFEQVKSEDRAVGFGIGLSFSKGIVEAHGSDIQVDSTVGKGSKFFFILERVAAPAATSTKAA